MRKIWLPVLMFLSVFGNISARAQMQNGREIMDAAYARPDGDDAFFSFTMELVDAKGAVRTRQFELYTKDYGALMKSVLRFNQPADIRDTAFLTEEQEEGDALQYLYLPALGRSRRIASSQKKVQFVNTEFTYEDMQRRRPRDDEHRLIETRACGKRRCYVVESVPHEGTSQYSRRVSLVDVEDFLVTRVDFYGTAGVLCKEWHAGDVTDIQGIRTPGRTIMRDLKNGRATVLILRQARYNQGLSDDIFTVRALEKK